MAVGGSLPSGATNEINVFSFDGLSLSLTDTFDYGLQVSSIDWSPCGKYLAVGGTGSLDGDEVKIFGFDGSSLALFIDTSDYSGAATSVSWSPCGKYVAVGGVSPSDFDEIKVFEVMDAPTGCIIDNNIASNSSSNGDLGGRAVGISGLCGNLFIRNLAENNVINITSGFPYKFFYYDPVGPLGPFDNVWSPNC